MFLPALLPAVRTLARSLVKPSLVPGVLAAGLLLGGAGSTGCWQPSLPPPCPHWAGLPCAGMPRPSPPSPAEHAPTSRPQVRTVGAGQRHPPGGAGLAADAHRLHRLPRHQAQGLLRAAARGSSRRPQAGHTSGGTRLGMTCPCQPLLMRMPRGRGCQRGCQERCWVSSPDPPPPSSRQHHHQPRESSDECIPVCRHQLLVAIMHLLALIL